MDQEPDYDALTAQRRVEAAEGLADILRGALALLWLSHKQSGPQMNVECCAAGMGLITADRKVESKPPEWLIEVASEVCRPDVWERLNGPDPV